MKKYISAIITVFLVFNLQTYLSAKESYEKKEAKTSFEQFLPSKNFTAQDLKNLLSDNSSISLEKIFLPPIKKVNNADMPQQLFPEEDYYEVYKRVLTNPSSSSDFNLYIPRRWATGVNISSVSLAFLFCLGSDRTYKVRIL